MARISSRTVASHCGKSREPVATSLLRGVQDEDQGNVREVSRPACAQKQGGGSHNVGESRSLLTMFTCPLFFPSSPRGTNPLSPRLFHHLRSLVMGSTSCTSDRWTCSTSIDSFSAATTLRWR